jgi:hypothetical protein
MTCLHRSFSRVTFIARQIDQVFAKILLENMCPSMKLGAHALDGDWIDASDVAKAFDVAVKDGAVAARRRCGDHLIIIDEVRVQQSTSLMSPPSWNTNLVFISIACRR